MATGERPLHRGLVVGEDRIPVALWRASDGSLFVTVTDITSPACRPSHHAVAGHGFQAFAVDHDHPPAFGAHPATVTKSAEDSRHRLTRGAAQMCELLLADRNTMVVAA